jgi:hypothetical protein
VEQWRAGLPDTIFACQKIPLWKYFGGHWNEKMLVNFYCHLVYFTTTRYTLKPFGLFCGHLVYLSRFGYDAPITIWQH